MAVGVQGTSGGVNVFNCLIQVGIIGRTNKAACLFREHKLWGYLKAQVEKEKIKIKLVYIDYEVQLCALIDVYPWQVLKETAEFCLNESTAGGVCATYVPTYRSACSNGKVTEWVKGGSGGDSPESLLFCNKCISFVITDLNQTSHNAGQHARSDSDQCLGLQPQGIKKRHQITLSLLYILHTVCYWQCRRDHKHIKKSSVSVQKLYNYIKADFHTVFGLVMHRK